MRAIGSRRTIGLGIIFVFLGGCAPALSSTQVSSLNAKNARLQQGDTYYLPRGIMTAWLVANASSGARLVIGQPEYLPDNGARWVSTDGVPLKPACASEGQWTSPGAFVLAHRVTGLHEDNMAIEVTDGLLKKITSDTKQKTTEALIAGAKSVGMLGIEAGITNDDRAIVSARFDPSDCREVAAIEKLLSDAISSGAVTDVLRELATANPKSPLAKMKLGVAQPISLSLNGFAPFHWPAAAALAPADCSVGVCVPVIVPASMSVAIAGRRYESPIVHLPNRSHPVAIPISRSGFADVKTTLTFDDRGILQKHEIAHGAELLAILSLPGDIVGANLDALSSGRQKRTTAINDAIKLDEARTKKKDGEKAEAAVTAPGTPLLEIPIPGFSIAPAAPAASVADLDNNGAAGSGKGGSATAPKSPRESPQGDGEDAGGKDTVKPAKGKGTKSNARGR